jgi:arginyl-tRNA synthetase
LVRQGRNFGKSGGGAGRRAVVEFVSANPTGPVHIGNARGGPLGDAIASLLEATGYEVTREFYVNDVGGQIDKLGKSILHSMRDKPEASSEKIEYQGSYVDELAAKAASKLAGKVPEDVTEAERVLGRFGMDELTGEIRKDCEDIGIRFDSWVSEKQVLATETQPILDGLKAKGVTVEKEGAVWLATDDEFLEDRECVLVRSDGRPTYFANDIAYHVGKYRRGFDRIINVWGSNHHGHVPRVKAAVKSLGLDPDKIETVLYQYVRVKRGADAVKMSKRAGNFVTAREVLDEVGRDAFRFFLLMRAPESHLDFDLKLATEKSAENPVYYVQYAHARICSIERKSVEAKIEPPGDEVDLSVLDLPEEGEMIRMIHEFPEEVARAADRLEPHRITFYLLELVKAFQAYYTKAKEDPRYRVLSAQVDTTQAKLYLCRALKLTISQGLTLLGVSAPEVMVQEDKGD